MRDNSGTKFDFELSKLLLLSSGMITIAVVLDGNRLDPESLYKVQAAWKCVLMSPIWPKRHLIASGWDIGGGVRREPEYRRRPGEYASALSAAPESSFCLCRTHELLCQS